MELLHLLSAYIVLTQKDRSGAGRYHYMHGEKFLGTLCWILLVGRRGSVSAALFILGSLSALSPHGS